MTGFVKICGELPVKKQNLLHQATSISVHRD